MEDECVINCFLGFWIHFCNVLCDEFDFMGRRFFSRRSVYHNPRAVLSDVRFAVIALNTKKPHLKWGVKWGASCNMLKAIMFMWVGITTPLCFLGAYYGYKKRAIEHPGKQTVIGTSLEIFDFSSNQSNSKTCSRTSILYSTHSRNHYGWYFAVWLHFHPTLLYSQFNLVASNLLHVWILASRYRFEIIGWPCGTGYSDGEKPYLRCGPHARHVFSNGKKVALILIITCSETTILLCYFHLAAEDYNWWWRSFMTSGFTAIYFFIYAAHYYSSKVIFNIFIILLRLGSPVFNLLVRPWDHKIWQK